MKPKLTLIVGGGGVLGGALAQVFSSAGYTVVGLRRGEAAMGGSMRSLTCDLQDATQTRAAVSAAIEEYSGIEVLICNAASFHCAPFMTLSDADFAETWRASVASSVGAAQAALPSMLGQGRGVILFSGATASLRGAANFAAFASAKFAVRGLAQSLAREYQARGVHVAHIILDGILGGSGSAQRLGVAPDHAIDPHGAAVEYLRLAEQPASAWTHELDLRPSTEKF